MSHDMGTFRTDVELENPASPGARQRVSGVLVDTGAELSCFPAPVLEALGVARQKSLRFRQADGSVFERWTGDAILYAAGTRTVDEVIFGEPEDIVLLRGPVAGRPESARGSSDEVAGGCRARLARWSLRVAAGASEGQ